MIVFGLTLALMIAFFMVQMILFNDGKIQKTFLRWDLMTASAADVALAFLVNIKLALISQALVMIVGLFLAVARLTPGKAGAPVRMLAIAYIDFFRAVPAIIVLYLIGFGLPLTGLPLICKVSSQWFAIIALTLTYSRLCGRDLSLRHRIDPSFAMVGEPVAWAFPLPRPCATSSCRRPSGSSSRRCWARSSPCKRTPRWSTSSARWMPSTRPSSMLRANFNLSSVLVVAFLFFIITIPQTRFVDWMLERAA